MNADKLLIFYSSKNSHGKKDATGAFIPEAKAFAGHYMVPDDHIIGVDCSQPKRQRRAQVLKGIESVEGLEGLLFFCHGWPTGIQFGFNLKNLQILAALIADSAADEIKIGLMACLTAENRERDNEVNDVGPATDGGFADCLRDEIVFQSRQLDSSLKKGWIDGHKTAGHTSWNPMVVRFLLEDVTEEDDKHRGGAWIVEPGSQYWRRWRAALKNNTDNLRYEFFRKDELAIKRKLAEMSS
jgi:hypothetical protein